jgi:hypothetical protein
MEQVTKCDGPNLAVSTNGYAPYSRLNVDPTGCVLVWCNSKWMKGLASIPWRSGLAKQVLRTTPRW